MKVLILQLATDTINIDTLRLLAVTCWKGWVPINSTFITYMLYLLIDKVLQQLKMLSAWQSKQISM